MACYHPIRAYRTRSGEVKIGKEAPDSTPLQLPCGGCLGCRKAKALEWALRCSLEAQQHKNAVFTTLTYSDENLPNNTLNKEHLSGFLKRLRKRAKKPIRFFGCGEYGTQRKRAHYHALLFGAAENDAQMIEDTWGYGYAQTSAITPRRIAYTAGYCNKKINFKLEEQEHVNLDTGEVYLWQPPFIQMSRRPGIGANAKQYIQSWRAYAIHDGQRLAVPRFLHAAWKEQATEAEIEQLEMEKEQYWKKKGGGAGLPQTPTSLSATAEKSQHTHKVRHGGQIKGLDRRVNEAILAKNRSLRAGEQAAKTKHELQSQKRRYG